MLSFPNFSDKLAEAVRAKKSILCCGLDPQIRYMPPQLIDECVTRYGRTFEAIGHLFYMFNRLVINAVHEFVVAVKPQMAFYERYGHHGVKAFEATVEEAKNHGLIVVTDAKRNDGGDTADAYADGHIGEVPFWGGGTEVSPLRSDCVTVTPYIGDACINPFVERGVKKYGTGVFVVTKTSFKPNSRVEQLELPSAVSAGPRVWQEVAGMVEEWSQGTEGACGLTNVGVVMGATYPEDAVKMRQILPNAWFLIPGYGKQGGGATDAVVGVRLDGLGGLANSSRGLTFPYWSKDGTLLCKPSQCFETVRAEAIRSRDELVDACKDAGKWPF